MKTFSLRFHTFALAAATVVSGPSFGGAQEGNGGISEAGSVLVASYRVDSSALMAVKSAKELVEALRMTLMVEAAMPLDEPMQVDLRGMVSNPAHGGAFPFAYSGLGILVEAGGTLSDMLSAATAAMHGPGSPFDDEGWSEDVAWDWLLKAIETGLTESLAADGRFGRGEDGSVALRVVSVREVRAEDWETEESLERMYLKLQPDAGFSSASDAGWEPPEGFSYDIRALLLELEPGQGLDSPLVGPHVPS
jgi:hypothetical protein